MERTVPQSPQGSSSSLSTTPEATSSSEQPTPPASQPADRASFSPSVVRQHRLIVACLNGHYDVVKIHLDRGGVDVNIKDAKGVTPLMAASLGGHFKIMELLLNREAHVNMQKNDGWSALMLASLNGHSEVVTLLIEKGANVNVQENDGWSALMSAIQNGHSEVVTLLIEKGANVNMQKNYGWSALMIASQYGHSEVAKLLIEKGAHVNMQENDGRSALMIASQKGHSEVAKLLIEKGANVNMQENDGRSALMIASQKGHSEVAKLLIEKGAHVNMQMNDGWSALMIASLYRHTTIVRLLINNHADTNLQNKDGMTALDWASEQGHADIVAILYDADTQEESSAPHDSGEIRPDTNTPVTIETREVITNDTASESEPPNIQDTSQVHEPEEGNKTVPERNPIKLDTGATNKNDEQKDGMIALDVASVRGHDVHELTVKVLFSELKTVTEPIKLGIGLGIEPYQLEIFRKNHPQDTTEQKISLFTFIANNYKVLGITWETIADALEETLDMRDLAQRIRKKFNCQSHVDSILSSPKDTSNEQISADLVLFQCASIGRGAFGTVFKGELNGKPCAIKVLCALADEIQTHYPIAQHAQQDSVERFHQECKYLESFNHPNVVRHLATRTHPKTKLPVLALELMDCNLRQFFTPKSAQDQVDLPVPIQKSLCHNIASALEYIHSRHVIHRDLCSDNILLDCTGEIPIAKVCDFGMSRLTQSKETSISLPAFGHRGYLPPEATHLEHTYYDSSFDIFQFGAIMVQIVCHLPTIKSERERKHQFKRINSAHPLKPLIEECLQETRENRPSATQLVRELA